MWAAQAPITGSSPTPCSEWPATAVLGGRCPPGLASTTRCANAAGAGRKKVSGSACSRPVHAVLGAGQQADCTRALELLQAVDKTGKVLADKAYDTNQVLAALAAFGAEAVIPSQPRRRMARPVDLVCHRQRNRIEWLMGRLKQFRRLATRYDKTASSYLGFVHFVCAMLWLR